MLYYTGLFIYNQKQCTVYRQTFGLKSKKFIMTDLLNADNRHVVFGCK